MKTIEEQVTPVDVEKVGEVITSKLPKFSKAQLVKSQKYIHRRDTLSTLLKEGEQYSIAQVDKMLKEFEEGVKK